MMYQLARHFGHRREWGLDRVPILLPFRRYVLSSLRTQTYFRLSLVSAENNVCEPEPENDFCDVMTFVSP